MKIVPQSMTPGLSLGKSSSLVSRGMQLQIRILLPPATAYGKVLQRSLLVFIPQEKFECVDFLV